MVGCASMVTLYGTSAMCNDGDILIMLIIKENSFVDSTQSGNINSVKN
jgi:hypothetical protein